MSLYFIALLPPEHIREEVKFLKEELRDRFGTEYALRLPAHITLVPPFKISEDKDMQLMQALEIFATTRKPFHLRLSGFGSFPPRVLFIDVVEKEKVRDLHYDLCKNLSPVLDLEDSREFNPHLTIASRDLEEAVFPAANKFLSSRDYESRFEVDGLTLLKHEDNRWEISMDFKFRKS